MNSPPAVPNAAVYTTYQYGQGQGQGITSDQTSFPVPQHPTSPGPPQYSYPPGAGITHYHSPPQQVWQQPAVNMQEKAFHSPQQVQVPVQVQDSPYRQAVPIVALNMSSAPVDCPGCGQRRMTATTPQSGNTTHAWAGVLCLLTGLLCFIPYLISDTKDVLHHCSNCGRLLAIWHRSGRVQQLAYA